MQMDAGIKGDLENPSIMVDMSIDNGSSMVYALPPKNFDLVNNEGVVEFVNLSEEESTQEVDFQQYIGDTIFSKINWIDLNAILTIDRGAQWLTWIQFLAIIYSLGVPEI